MEYLQILRLIMIIICIINVILSVIEENKSASWGWTVGTFALLILFLKGV
jgi:hypothetical protein